MMQDRLDHNVERYYRDQKLDPVALERLKTRISSVKHPAGEPGTTKSWTLFAAAVAAMIIVAIGSVFLFTEAASTPDEVAREITTQAALIHNQQLDMEFEATGYDELRSSMPKLDFNPVEPARFRGKNLKVVGARYGMLEGQPAVQITLLEPDGGYCTLYQMRPTGQLAEVQDDAREIDGLSVELWKEKGLLMVLARPAA